MLDRLYDHSAKSSSWIAVSAVISFLTAQGINRVKASAAIGNDASVILFEKLNFTMLGIEADELTFCLNVI